MNYPISQHDILNIDLDDDEQATLVALEAHLNDQLSDIKFANDLSPETVVRKLQSWNRYDEYRNLISQQKSYLRYPIAENQHKIIDNDDINDVAASLTVHAIESLSKSSRQPIPKYYSLIRVAASLAIIFFISVGVLSYMQYTTGTQKKSASVSKSDSLSNISSPEKAQDQQSGVQSNPSMDSVQGDPQQKYEGYISPNGATSNSLTSPSSTKNKTTVPNSAGSNDRTSKGIIAPISNNGLIILLLFGSLFLVSGGIIFFVIKKKI